MNSGERRAKAHRERDARAAAGMRYIAPNVPIPNGPANQAELDAYLAHQMLNWSKVKIESGLIGLRGSPPPAPDPRLDRTIGKLLDAIRAERRRPFISRAGLAPLYRSKPARDAQAEPGRDVPCTTEPEPQPSNSP